ncbi:MAG: hypothetical protein ACLPR9_20245 [Acidimicrobiales bacterium]
MTVTELVATNPDGYSPSGINEATSARVTSAYLRASFAGTTMTVPVRKAPPGMPMWKVILLRQGYEEQAAASLAIAEFAAPAAIQSMDNPY